jgi:hypothetical protein
MADSDKQIVTIGWLKDQGYSIKEAYTDNTWCPTFNNITAGTIGSSIGVSATCYGTGSEYSANQVVCRKDVYLSYVCTCSDLTVSPQELTWSYDQVTAKTSSTATLSTNNCISNVTVTSTDEDICTASVSDNTVTITPVGVAGEASVIIDYDSDSTSCSETIICHFSDLVCDCDKISTIEWTYANVTAKTSSSITLSTPSCTVSGPTLIIGDDSLCSASISDGVLTITPKGVTGSTTVKAHYTYGQSGECDETVNCKFMNCSVSVNDIEIKSDEVVDIKKVMLNVRQINTKKVILSYNNGADDYVVECNGDSVLYNSEVKPSSRSYQNISYASIGTCVSKIVNDYRYDGLFKGCTSITGVEFSSTVTELGYESFYGCTALKSVHIPKNITHFGHGVFENCTSLSSVTFDGQRMTQRGISTFENCTSLREIVLPLCDTSYDLYCDVDYVLFENCTNLRKVTFPANSGYKYIHRSFIGCSSLVDINIPDTIESVWEGSFKGCSSLTALTFSSALKDFGEYACSGCTSLRSFTCYATTPPRVGWFNGGYHACWGKCNIFEGCDNLTIYVPAESVTAYKEASGWSQYADRIQAIP